MNKSGSLNEALNDFRTSSKNLADKIELPNTVINLQL